MAEENEQTNEQVIEPNPQDNPRNKLFAEIARAEEDSKTDLVDVADADHDKTETVAEEPEPQQTVAPEPRKMKLKVNGQEMELTEAEVIERAQKAEAAEQRFQEAARLRKEAEELRAQPPAAKVEAVPTVDDDDRALARALQMGSEEEAAGVIKRIRSQAVNPGQIAGMVEMVAAGNWFREQYPEIFADEWLRSIALNEDEKLVQSGDRRPYRERYKSIGDKLREWRGTKETAALESKKEKKATLQVVPKADVRAPAPNADEDGPTDREFIAAEAKRRGQGFPR